MPTTTFELSLAAFAAAVLMIIAAKIAERQLRRFDITQLRNTRFHWNHLPTRLLLLSTTMLLSSVFGSPIRPRRQPLRHHLLPTTRAVPCGPLACL